MPISDRCGLRILPLIGLSIAVCLAAVAPAGASPRAEPALPVGSVPTPPPSGATSMPAHVPSGVATFSATTGGDTEAVPAMPEGLPQSIIGDQESVIGADGRVRLPRSATDVYPLSAIGQIEFTPAGTSGRYICTGYLIDGNSLLTAGHCSYDGVNGEGGRIQSATFFPGRNRAQGIVVNPFGSCAVVDVWAPDKWKDEGVPAHDYSVQQLAPGCDFSESAGSFGLFTLPGTNAFAGRRLRVEGYPGDKGYGSRWQMVGAVDHNSINTLHYPMDTYGGQSGSPLFRWNRPECGGPCSAGVHAYGAFGTPPTNSGPMMTTGRIGTIAAVAAQNGG